MTGIQDLFTPAVAAVEVRGPELDETLLWPEEALALGDVAPGRRLAFVAGRRCARLAVAQLGWEPSPILIGSKRQPMWPRGLVGSITHTSGYAAAAVTIDDGRTSIGIDCEPDAPLADRVLARIADPWEVDGLSTWTIEGVTHLDRALFCVKESVYKAWFPVARRWLGFHDVRVDMGVGDGRFVVEVLVDGPMKVLEGSVTGDDGYVIAAIEHRGPA